MTTQRFQRVKRVFEAVLEAAGDDRSALLEQLCGSDAELKNEVLRLLQEHDSFSDSRQFPALGVPPGSFLKLELARHFDTLIRSQTGPNTGGDRQPARSGEVVSHYEIIHKIGAGGMGVVYKARDTKLERTVAVKFLASSLIYDEDSRRRFIREAKAAAALNHPNICTVHEIDEIEKDLFIVMEFIAGQDLAARIRSGPLPAGEALSIATQVGEALHAAHERGIVHRDVKCSNIMVTAEGRAKILDFGLAQFDQVQLTADSGLMGTPSFMSPEQLTGTVPLDVRTDIWSLAVVLYEMMTGRLPFQEKYVTALKYSIIHEPPVSLRTLCPGAPAGIDDLIQRALQKNPSDRYTSIQEMVREMRLIHGGLEPAGRVRRVSGDPPVCSVAVLPFLNMSADRDNEYFTDGLTDEIINALTQLQGLRVVSRGSTFAFKGTSRDVRQVSERLRVDVVVDGSVRVAGDRLRVTAQLIGAPDGFQLWAQKYDRAKTDVFELQDELTQRIVDSLKARLAQRTSRFVVKRYTNNLKAHESYLRGKYFLNQQTRAGARRAIDSFEEAIKFSVEYPLPHVGLAESYMLLTWYGFEGSEHLVRKAEEAVETALGLDNELAAAHCVLGMIRAGYQWEWEEAEQAFLAALAKGPGFPASHFHYAMDYLTPMGRLDEAYAEIEMALQFDPLSLIIETAIGGCLYRQREYERAIKSLRDTLAKDAAFYHAHWTIGKVFEQTGDFESALAALIRAAELEGSHPSILADLGHCYAKSGNEREALTILSRLDELARRSYVSPLCRAVIYLGLGQTGRTLEWLEKAYDERSRGLVWIGVDPRFAALGSENAFRGLVKRIGVPGRIHSAGHA